MNRIGELLDSTMIDVQNEVCMINEVKQASEIDIDTFKLMHNTLAKILKKWRDIVLETINKDNACSKPKDTKKKDNKPDTKKKDSKPDTKKKDSKPDTKKEDNKPDTRKKDNKPDTSKKKLKIGPVIGLNMRYKILQNIGKF